MVSGQAAEDPRAATARARTAARQVWRRILAHGREVALLAATPEAVLSGPAAPMAVLSLRAELRGEALARFPVDGASVEYARQAFTALGRATLDAGLPRVRRRFAVMLAVAAEELDGLLDDDAAAETAAGLARLGLAGES